MKAIFIFEKERYYIYHQMLNLYVNDTHRYDYFSPLKHSECS